MYKLKLPDNTYNLCINNKIGNELQEKLDNLLLTAKLLNYEIECNTGIDVSINAATGKETPKKYFYIEINNNDFYFYVQVVRQYNLLNTIEISYYINNDHHSFDETNYEILLEIFKKALDKI